MTEPFMSSEMPSAADLVQRFLTTLHERSLRRQDEVARADFTAAFQTLISAYSTGDRIFRDELLRHLTAALTPDRPHYQFGCIANTCGMIVEAGADPAIALEPILDRLPQLFSLVPALREVLRQDFA